MPFKPAKCPNCAGDLQVPEDRDTVKCMYCGSDIIVREAIKAAGGVNIENLMVLAKTAENSSRYDEAYEYYSKVLEHDSENVNAWIGKAISSLFRFGTIINTEENVLAKQCIDKAIALTKGKEEFKTEIKNRIINEKVQMCKWCQALKIDITSFFLLSSPHGKTS